MSRVLKWFELTAQLEDGGGKTTLTTELVFSLNKLSWPQLLPGGFSVVQFSTSFFICLRPLISQCCAFFRRVVKPWFTKNQHSVLPRPKKKEKKRPSSLPLPWGSRWTVNYTTLAVHFSRCYLNMKRKTYREQLGESLLSLR